MVLRTLCPLPTAGEDHSLAAAMKPVVTTNLLEGTRIRTLVVQDGTFSTPGRIRSVRWGSGSRLRLPALLQRCAGIPTGLLRQMLVPVAGVRIYFGSEEDAGVLAVNGHLDGCHRAGVFPGYRPISVPHRWGILVRVPLGTIALCRVCPYRRCRILREFRKGTCRFHPGSAGCLQGFEGSSHAPFPWQARVGGTRGVESSADPDTGTSHASGL